MTSGRSLRLRQAVLALGVLSAELLLPSNSNAQVETILHSFSNRTGVPFELVSDKTGSLYGITAFGGKSNCQLGCGTVYELSPGTNGWTQRVLYAFAGGLGDGYMPDGELTFDQAGNLYGTTRYGGSQGFGTLFKLSPTSSGPWRETIIHNFGGVPDGGLPNGGLLIDVQGNIYGATVEGGHINSLCGGAGRSCGIVFQFSQKNGRWVESIVYAFDGTHGYEPNGDLIFDTAGSLYGVSEALFGQQAFKLFKDAKGKWREQTLFTFQSFATGQGVIGGLAIDPAGNLYGATSGGGSRENQCLDFGCGLIFQLSSTATGPWNEVILHEFNGTDATAPNGGVVIDSAGNLFGVANGGLGIVCSCGIAYESSPIDGGWNTTVLHDFGDVVGDGLTPQGKLLLDTQGNVYGTTGAGGAFQRGTVFQISQ